MQRACGSPQALVVLGACLLADVGEQGHDAGAFDGLADGTLVGGAEAATLAAEHAALSGAELLQAADVLVVNEGGTGAALGGAEPALLLRCRGSLLGHVFLKYSRNSGRESIEARRGEAMES